MPNFSFSKIDNTVERRIIIGMVTDTNFLKKVRPMITKNSFAMQASQIVANWCCEYIDKYEEAPFREIQDVYRVKRKKLNDSDAEWISEFLNDISEEYENTKLNTKRLLEQAKEHFNEQSMRDLIEKAEQNLDNGKPSKAKELLMVGLKNNAEDFEDMGIDPFTYESLRMVFDHDDRFEVTLGMDRLDQIAGKHKSEWLTIFIAPMKKGKTRTLTHIAVNNALKGHNVVLFSLESGYNDLISTIWMSYAGLTTKPSGKVKIPYYDDEESANDKKSKKRLKKKGRSKLKIRGKIKDNYHEAKKVNDEDAVRKAISDFNLMSKGRLKVKSFPAYSAGTAEIEAYLDALEAYENFQPTVIIVDYLGAMKKPAGMFGRDVYDTNSKELKGMAQRRKASVFTAHQGKRENLEKMNMNPTDVPEDVRVLANADVIYGIMQSEKEKEKGIIRFCILMHRFKKFSRKQVEVLTAPEIGQLYLDGNIIDPPEEIKNKRNRKNDKQPEIDNKNNRKRGRYKKWEEEE